MTLELLGQVLSAGARDLAAGEDVAIEGADPVFPISLRVGEAGAAAVAAAGLAAADLWAFRTGERQSVRVAVDAAAATLRGYRYLRMEEPGETSALAPERRAPVSGIYPTRDGRWIYLHCNFANHRERIVRLLEASDDPDGVASAVAGRDAHELEAAVVTAGACAGVVRSEAEWRASATGIALNHLPLFEVTRIADGPAAPMPDGGRPLSGIRVLDLTRVLAGPICARTLAEHGATVLRVGANHLPNQVVHTIDTGHGKHSTALNLGEANDADRLLRLIDRTDVFSESYRPGSLAARGLAPEALARRRPGIVYVTLTAFGHEGPWADRRGFDTLVQAVSGIAAEYADAGGTPRLLPVAAIDYITGYLAAFGVMRALIRRAIEGGSYLVRVSLAQTGRWLQSLPRLDAAAVASAQADLPAERIREISTTSEGPFGRLHHLAPIAQLSATPARWDVPTRPLDHDPPSWP